MVTADPHMRDLYRGMTDDQWNWYFGEMEQRNDHGMAHMALGLNRNSPTHTDFRNVSELPMGSVAPLKPIIMAEGQIIDYYGDSALN